MAFGKCPRCARVSMPTIKQRCVEQWSSSKCYQREFCSLAGGIPFCSIFLVEGVHIWIFIKAWMFHIIKSGACCLSKIFDSLFLSLANKVTADIFITMFFFLVNEPEKPITWDQIPFHLELILFTGRLFPLLYSCFFPLQFWQFSFLF